MARLRFTEWWWRCQELIINWNSTYTLFGGNGQNACYDPISIHYPNFAQLSGHGNYLFRTYDRNHNLIHTACLTIPSDVYLHSSAYLVYTERTPDGHFIYGPQKNDSTVIFDKADSNGNFIWKNELVVGQGNSLGAIEKLNNNKFLFFLARRYTSVLVPIHYGSQFEEDIFLMETDTIGSIN